MAANPRTRQGFHNLRSHCWACLACPAVYTQKIKACTECGGAVQYFGSKREFGRFRELQVLQQAGQITGLSLQPKFPVVINGHQVTEYRADFKYIEDGREVVEDVKATVNPKYQDPVFLLKKKLVEAVYGITITITT